MARAVARVENDRAPDDPTSWRAYRVDHVSRSWQRWRAKWLILSGQGFIEGCPRWGDYPGFWADTDRQGAV